VWSRAEQKKFFNFLLQKHSIWDYSKKFSIGIADFSEKYYFMPMKMKKVWKDRERSEREILLNYYCGNIPFRTTYTVNCFSLLSKPSSHSIQMNNNIRFTINIHPKMWLYFENSVGCCAPIKSICWVRLHPTTTRSRRAWLKTRTLQSCRFGYITKVNFTTLKYEPQIRNRPHRRRNHIGCWYKIHCNSFLATHNSFHLWYTEIKSLPHW